MQIIVNYSNYNAEIENATLQVPSVGEMTFTFITDETDPENPIQKLQLTNSDTLEATTQYQFTKAEFLEFQKLLRNLTTQL